MFLSGDLWGRASRAERLAPELGALLAQIHGVPTRWYATSRADLLQKHPILEEAPESSSLWQQTNRNSRRFLESGLSDEALRGFIETEWQPEVSNFALKRCILH